MSESSSDTAAQTADVERRLRERLLDSTGDGIVVADAAGKFVVWNRAATELVGVGAADVPPERWSEFYRLTTPGTDELMPTDSIPLVAALRGSVVHDVDLVCHNRRSGRRVWLNCEARPVHDGSGNVIGGVVVFRDVTERRRVEQELEAFARTISHDLKAPLTGITGFADLMREEYGDTLDEDAREYLDQITDSARRMGELIEGLLDHCRIGQEWHSVTAADLNEAVRSALNALAGDIERTGASVTVQDDLPTVSAHPGGLRQALQNLIGNAIKFVDPGQTPRIEIGCVEDDSSWRIFVKDHGIGIDSKYHGDIFGVFRRLHGRDRYEGTGIGLAIVKKIADLHQGDVRVESEPGRGSTFWLQLPKTDFPDTDADASNDTETGR